MRLEAMNEMNETFNERYKGMNPHHSNHNLDSPDHK